MSVEECEAAYLKLSERIFNPRRSSANLIGRAKDAWKVEGRFDAEELKACIIELLEERKVDKETLLMDPESICKV
jgi:predicted transcriptional regulator